MTQSLARTINQTLSARRVEILQVARFGLVGITATLTYLGLSLLLLHLGTIPQLASFLASLVSVSVSYFGHYFFTYRANGSHLMLGSRFAVMTLTATGLCAALNEAALLLGAAPRAAAFIVTLAYPPLGFLLNHFWTFAGERER